MDLLTARYRFEWKITRVLSLHTLWWRSSIKYIACDMVLSGTRIHSSTQSRQYSNVAWRWKKKKKKKRKKRKTPWWKLKMSKATKYLYQEMCLVQKRKKLVSQHQTKTRNWDCWETFCPLRGFFSLRLKKPLRGRNVSQQSQFLVFVWCCEEMCFKEASLFVSWSFIFDPDTTERNPRSTHSDNSWTHPTCTGTRERPYNTVVKFCACLPENMFKICCVQRSNTPQGSVFLEWTIDKCLEAKCCENPWKSLGSNLRHQFSPSIPRPGFLISNHVIDKM